MEDVRFLIVHFNNRTHDWGYYEANYEADLLALVMAVRALTTSSETLIWASTTPVRFDRALGPTDSSGDARYNIALSFVKSAGIAFDDQHAMLMQQRDS